MMYYTSRPLYGGGSGLCVYFVYVSTVLCFVGLPPLGALRPLASFLGPTLGSTGCLWTALGPLWGAKGCHGGLLGCLKAYNKFLTK